VAFKSFPYLTRLSGRPPPGRSSSEAWGIGLCGGETRLICGRANFGQRQWKPWPKNRDQDDNFASRCATTSNQLLAAEIQTAHPARLPALPSCLNSNSASAQAPDAASTVLPASHSLAQAGKANAQRIFLVDDHPLTRQGLSMLINLEPDLVVCGEAGSAPVALEMMRDIKPDLAVVDITLETTSGIELLKSVHALLPNLPVLIMSMHDESLYAERALRAGAKGYVMKHEPGDRLLLAIRSVLQGEIYLSAKMQESMMHQVARNKKGEVVFTIETLSAREREVFQLIGNGFGTREIAEKLELSIKTIDSYRDHLKLKLRLKTGPDLVRHAIQWVRSESVI